MSDQKQKLNMIMALGFGNQIRARSVQVAAYTFFTTTTPFEARVLAHFPVLLISFFRPRLFLEATQKAVSRENV